MSDHRNIALVKRMFDVFVDFDSSLSDLSAFMSEGFYQKVDGKTLGREEFLDHAVTLRQHVQSLSIEFVEIFATDTRVATVHVAHVVRNNGEHDHVRVVAVYGVDNGRISFVDELTHATDHATKSLGSITSHDHCRS